MQIIIDTKKYKLQDKDLFAYDEKEKTFKPIQLSMLFKEQNEVLIKTLKRVAELEDRSNEYEGNINKKVNALAKSVDTLLGD